MKKIICKLIGHSFIKNYEYDDATRSRVDHFFNAIDKYSSSTELITTWLGKPNEWGGMVVIPWNLLAHYVHGVAGNEFCRRCGKESIDAKTGEEHLIELKEMMARKK